ncbi:MAG: glycosyltransferase [Solirubrobacteraceae bacterium]
MKLISVIVPAYNETACVDELARRLGAVFDGLSAYRWEAIIVENGSLDDTYERLVAIRERDPRFKIVQLARNFRMDGGITAGLQFASGDAAVIMTADLQDPPELIAQFVAKWEEGGTIVVSEPGRLNRSVVLRGRLRAAAGEVAVVAEDGRRTRLRADTRSRAFVLRVPVPAGGETSVRLRAPTARTPIELRDLTTAEALLQPR